MKKEKGNIIISTIAALLIAVLVVSAAVALTLFDRNEYYDYVQNSDLPTLTGIPEEEIINNYDALIDYNSVFFNGPLEFPTFPMSDNGREHFREVKTIFSSFQIALIVSIICLIPLCIVLLKKRKYGFLLAGGVLAIVIPAAVGVIMTAVGWDDFFVLFHQLFFNNDFWIFDAISDPVIIILPDDYFMMCLSQIIAGICIPAMVLIIITILIWRRSAKLNEPRIPIR